MKRALRAASAALLVLAAARAGGQTPAPTPSATTAKKPLSLEAISGFPPIVPPGIADLAWRDARRATYVLAEGFGPGAKSAMWEVDALTGRKTQLLTPVPLPKEPAADGKEAPDAKPKTLPLRGARWNPAGTALLLTGEGDLWLYDVERKSLARLTNDADEEEYPTFSPDGSRLAYVKNGDLWALGVASGNASPVRLTTTGGPHVFNGRLDWVYEEELANRRSGRSYEWAPDSTAIAYLRLDENRVPEFPIVDFLPSNGKLLPQRYPKAGDPNAKASVHVVELRGDAAAETAVWDYSEEDVYVAPELEWTPDSKGVSFLKINRAQDRVDVFLAPRAGGAPRTLLTETDPAWINFIQPPVFLKDGSGFLFTSERTGFAHVYRYGMDGALKNAVTKGPWMRDGELEVDEAGGFVYFVATEKDPRERHLYRVRLDGSGFIRLSKADGVHSFRLAPGGGALFDTFSSLAEPPRTALLKPDGTLVSEIHRVPNGLAAYAHASVEMGSFTAPDGLARYFRLVKPPDFDPAKKYPVVVYVYGGPHAQTVQNRWGSASLLEHLLASKGFLVWAMDGRGSWGRGHAFETPLLKKMGATELEDQLAGIAELKKRSFVDGARLGIWGWSYGGYLTLYAATHAGATFRCAVAGAPVTDWKFYDSIYTERYMKLPKENPDGYKASSPLEAAKDLGPKLLLLHGTSDDNVHMQNSIAFADALMRARKDFAFVPLPRQKHGPADPAARLYVSQRIVEWFEKNL